MGSLDTNALLRWLFNDVPKQAKAVEAMIAEHSELRINDVVFFELEYYLRKQLGMTRSLVSQNILQIIEHPKFTVRHKLLSLVLGEYLRHPALSFGDCYLALSAHEYGALPLYTFDKKLTKQLPALATEILT